MKVLDLGSKHLFEYSAYGALGSRPVYIGGVIYHSLPSGKICVTGIKFKEVRDNQDLDLSLDEEIVCSKCGDKGKIQKGKWIS